MINKPTVGIFSGSASISLSEEVAKILGLKLGNIDLGKFSDGEIKVEILENVRGHEAYIIQSTCAPTNSNLMELMLITDALKRSSASRITAILPYYGYARQDRRVRSARVPISAKVIADMMNSVGVDRVLTVDLHSESIQGFFDMPADNVYATKIMHDDIKSRSSKDEKILVVSQMLVE
jgi:ribose-phosphate pyrophosphokinase